jgi:TetR/AcrR family transcriptional regulator, transcriptional repressor for nem operon
MKKSRIETAETRKRILKVASQEFKRNGIQATRVSEIMAAAGLTHGGFYRHFESKEALLAEACEAAMGNMADNAHAAIEGGDQAFAEYLNDFLSRNVHEDCEVACTFVTMGSELARTDERTRHTLSEGFRTWIEILSRRGSDEEGAQAARADAMFKLSAMIGAVTLARIIDDPAFADEVLAQARDRLVVQAELARVQETV